MEKYSLTVPKLTQYDVVVFDLDDTLYSEKSYVESGYQAIAHYINILFNKDFLSALKNNIKASNVLASSLQELELPEYLLPQLIQIYRYHEPQITLLPKIENIVNTLKKNSIPLYIITDGRSLTQRLKIEGLGIKHYFQGIYISEEQGFEKPSLHSFSLISKSHQNQKIVYIGDNPKKDFIAPHQLGWDTIGIKHQAIRVHPMNIVEAPRYWIENTNDLQL